MASSDIHERVAAQFGPTAARYATSEGHNHAPVLAELVELVNPLLTDSVLDIATGAGSVALAFAPRVKSSTALDLTPSMLIQVEQTAKERGLSNVITVHAKAEDLPFPDHSFDIVTVRLAPHHFADVPSFIKGVHRVLKPGGKFLLVDTVAPEDASLDEQINHMELLRDPSHVRNYRVSEWHKMLTDAGFTVNSSVVGDFANGTRMELMGWMERINTPQQNREELTGIFFDPTPEMIETLKIERVDDVVTFTLPELTLLATA